MNYYRRPYRKLFSSVYVNEFVSAVLLHCVSALSSLLHYRWSDYSDSGSAAVS